MNEALHSWLKAHTPAPTRRRLRRVQAMAHNACIRLAHLVAPPAKPNNPDGKVCLNLGCGYVTHPTFINVDALVARHIHYIRPVDDLRPFKTNSVDLVYVSHCLEHIGHQRVDEVLAEWWRVLKPGGVLRLGVPDFEQLLAAFEAGGRNIETIQFFLMGGQDYPLNVHRTSFTKASLTNRLRAVGFREVRTWQWGSNELTSLPDFTNLQVTVDGRTIPLSLNLEAIK
jgi:predicted SAM-dependent methyltransferase